MPFTSLDEWLAWLEQAHPREIDLGLDRIRQVAERLQLLDPGVPVVTVAGTNGKGSCVAAVADLAKAAGMRVGVYTSPHLCVYNERVCIDGQRVDDAQLCASFARIYQACDGLSLTYFEYGTLAAFDIFARADVDLLVLEVGLGGRLDAVNLLDPDIAVITSIDLDHQDWLGDTRETIAREKAGIMRFGHPMVCADTAPPQSLLDIAAELAVPGLLIDRDFGFSVSSQEWYWWGQASGGQRVQLGPMPLPHLPLPSLAAAIQVAYQLGWVLTPDEIGQRLARLQLPGRFQRLEWRGREIILDVAHNPAASAYLAARLASEPRPRRRVALVAMMADKDRPSSLASLASQIDAWYLVKLELARAATPEQLAVDLASLGIEAEGQGIMDHCLAQALIASEPGDQIIIWGSFFTVAAALDQIAPTGGRQG